MFSKNERISARQVRSLLTMDWLAKLSLLLPVYLAGRNPGAMAVCLAAGVLLWLLFSVLLPEDADFFGLISKRLGRLCAWLVYLTGLFYFLSHTAVCMSLCANLASVYLLPETPLPVLVLLPLAAGLYLSCSKIEVHGRLGEVLAPVILFLFLLLTAFAAGGMHMPADSASLFGAAQSLPVGIYEVFACMGGMFLPVLAPYVKRESGGLSASVRRSACRSLIPAGILLLITAASFGSAGMAAFAFPTVRVMSNVTVPGGFVQRWDVLFLMLLLFSLSFSVGNGFWYQSEIVRRLLEEAERLREQYMFGRAECEAARTWQDAGVSAGLSREEFSSELTGFEKPRQGWEYALARGVLIFVSFCAAGGFRSAETAIVYYRAYNLYVLTPVMLLVYLLLFFQGKRRTAGMAAFFLALCLTLSGCTARELEDRMFPLALELRAEDAQLVMTYAWSQGNADAGSAEKAGQEQETETAAGQENQTEQEGRKEGMEMETARKEQADGTEAGTEGAGPEERGNLTVFRGDTLEAIFRQVEDYGDRYIDYSHVKAFILDENLEQYPEAEQELYRWLAGEPAFAASLIIYLAQESGLSLTRAAERSGGNIGTYLENLYENNQKLREAATTLGRLTAEYYG